MCEAARNERCYQAPFRRVRDTGERVTRLGLVWPLMLGDGPWASRSASRGDVAQCQASQLIERRIRLKHVKPGLKIGTRECRRPAIGPGRSRQLLVRPRPDLVETAA